MSGLSEHGADEVGITQRPRDRAPFRALTATGLILCAALAAQACRDRDFLHYYVDGSIHGQVSRDIKVKRSDQIDLLWVIDNSGSMLSYLPDLSDNAASFMKGFTADPAVDWRMAIVSTDPMDTPFLGLKPMPVFDRSDLSPVRTFSTAVTRLGERRGSDREQGFAPALQALSQDPAFLRPNALLVVIFMTDAPEQGTLEPSAFVNELRKLKPRRPELVTVYGAFSPRDFQCAPTDDAWDYAGSRYEQVIQATGGSTVSLCTGDFGEELSKIGQQIGQSEKTSVILPERPRVDSIRVTADGKTLPGGPKESGGSWLYDYAQNAVVIHELPAPGNGAVHVVVEYEREQGQRPEGRV